MIGKTINLALFVGLFKKYREKIYLLFSLIVLFFLIEHLYEDIRFYLLELHPEYLIAALWIKSILLIILCIALLISLKPKAFSEAAEQHERDSQLIPLSQNDKAIVEKVSKKPQLLPKELFPASEVQPKDFDEALSQPDEDIISAIRGKESLESRAEKITKSLSDNQRDIE